MLFCFDQVVIRPQESVFLFNALKNRTKLVTIYKEYQLVANSDEVIPNTLNICSTVSWLLTITVHTNYQTYHSQRLPVLKPHTNFHPRYNLLILQYVKYTTTFTALTMSHNLRKQLQ